MVKKFFLLSLITITLLVNTPLVFAATAGLPCTTDPDCTDGTSCLPYGTGPKLCQVPTNSTVFGKITPPPAIQSLNGGDSSGVTGLSYFLSNLIGLIFSLAMVVLVFMLIWGAFDWLTSEGDKEKVDNARKKITNAFVGIMLFAIAWAVIQLLGHFTGFTFFVGQRK